MAENKSQSGLATDTSRRELLKKAAYVTPLVLTLAATPAFAAGGSKEPKEKPKREKD